MMSVDSLCKTVVCVDCKCTESSFWHKSNGSAICTTCYCQRDSLNRSTRSQGLLSSNSTSASSKAAADESRSSDNSASVVRSGSANITRKSSRLKPSMKNRAWQNVVKPSATKGRSRRFVFKKNPTKSPSSVATVVTSDYIFYDGSYWQVGDIVAVIDVDDGQKYYAQLRGFLEDQYYQKSAVITWLVPSPSSRSPHTGFDPLLYVAGPDEDLPRDMAHFEFICHAPSDYYRHGTQYKSYPVDSPLLGCVWTAFGPNIEVVDSNEGVDRLTESEHKSRQSAAVDDAQKFTNENDKRAVSVREKTRSQKAGSTRPKDKLMK